LEWRDYILSLVEKWSPKKHILDNKSGQNDIFRTKNGNTGFNIFLHLIIHHYLKISIVVQDGRLAPVATGRLATESKK